jgi:hypothetical protein
MQHLHLVWFGFFFWSLRCLCGVVVIVMAVCPWLFSFPNRPCMKGKKIDAEKIRTIEHALSAFTVP